MSTTRNSSEKLRITDSAFSLVETLIVIAILGIITAIAVPSAGKISSGGKTTIAQNLTEKLNRGVRSFSQANWDMTFSAIEVSGGDELLVLRSLQYAPDDSNSDGFHGAPYFRNDWNPTTSNDTDDYRIQWTGSAWKLLLPGDSGYGLKVLFDASDIGEPFTFPDAFVPVGSR